MALTDRASLLREYFRLVDSDSTDDGLTEHDSSTLEGAYLDLQGGYEDAQLYLIEQGLEELWIKTQTVTSVSGSEPERYVALESDFLKLDGDYERSALWYAGGVKWGRLVPSERRRALFGGNAYYLRGSESTGGQKRLYFGRGAGIPNPLYVDYVYRVGTLADGTTVDFPVEDRSLIAAFAAVRGMSHAWFTGDGEDKAEIRANLQEKKGSASRRARLTRQPKMVDPRPVRGARWML